MQELKLRIKQLRTMLGLSMAKFASIIEVSPGNVGDWESLKRPSVPSAAALKMIGQKCDVSLDWLLLGYERTNVIYSEKAIGRFSANSTMYEELSAVMIKLPEEQLNNLLEYAKQLEKPLKGTRENANNKTYG